MRGAAGAWISRVDLQEPTQLAQGPALSMELPRRTRCQPPAAWRCVTPRRGSRQTRGHPRRTRSRHAPTPGQGDHGVARILELLEAIGNVRGRRAEIPHGDLGRRIRRSRERSCRCARDALPQEQRGKPRAHQRILRNDNDLRPACDVHAHNVRRPSRKSSGADFKRNSPSLRTEDRQGWWVRVKSAYSFDRDCSGLLR